MQNKIIKINLLASFLFLFSCRVTINQASYDLENQFDGEIVSSLLGGKKNQTDDLKKYLTY